MDSKQLQNELKAFRQRLKRLRDQYSDVADRDAQVEVEDKVRRAYIQLGRAQDSLDNLGDELARAEKHLAALVKAERGINTKRKNRGRCRDCRVGDGACRFSRVRPLQAEVSGATGHANRRARRRPGRGLARWPSHRRRGALALKITPPRYAAGFSRPALR